MADIMSPSAYYKALASRLTPLEKLTDKAHSLDERIDITNLLLIALLQATGEATRVTRPPRAGGGPQINRALREHKLTIPANTPSSRPATLVVVVGEEPELTGMSGYVDKVQVILPLGCAGLVHIYATYKGEQIWPANKEGTFSGDNEVIEWDNDGLFLDAFPTYILLHGWNEDDTWEHTPRMRLRVV